MRFAVLLLATVVALGVFVRGSALTPGPSESAVASEARVVTQSFWSAALNRSMPSLVYLPPGYDSQPQTRYPVLFMLHGLGGDYTSWERLGLFTETTALISSGQIPPMIIVTPEGEQGYWMNHSDNGPRFGDYISKDLVSAVDKQYRTLAIRDFRAIGGASMGGHGALQLALNNPDEFGVVGAHSVALRRKEQAFSFFGDQRYFEANDPVTLCARNQAVASRLVLWIDMGTSDSWLDPAKRFHDQLALEGVPHFWQTYQGGHDDGYWSSHLDDYLRFYAAAFEIPSAMVPA